MERERLDHIRRLLKMSQAETGIAGELLAHIDALAAEHARCTNLTNAEAARIFEEAREMRTERDALAAELAMCRAISADYRERIEELSAEVRCLSGRLAQRPPAETEAGG